MGINRDMTKAGISGKFASAYFTLEAALVLPVVLGIIFLIIYLLFYQYDRCLMEQDAGILALRGCTIQDTDAKYVVARLRRQSEDWDFSYYFAWNTKAADITWKSNQVTVSQSGSIKFPFKGLIFWSGNDTWECKVSFKNHRISPASFLRTYRTIKHSNAPP